MHIQLYAHNDGSDDDDISVASHHSVLTDDAGYLPFDGL